MPEGCLFLAARIFDGWSPLMEFHPNSELQLGISPSQYLDSQVSHYHWQAKIYVVVSLTLVGIHFCAYARARGK